MIMCARPTEFGKKGQKERTEPDVKVSEFWMYEHIVIIAIHHLISVLTAFIQPLTQLCSVFEMTGTLSCVLIGGSVG